MQVLLTTLWKLYKRHKADGYAVIDMNIGKLVPRPSSDHFDGAEAGKYVMRHLKSSAGWTVPETAE